MHTARKVVRATAAVILLFCSLIPVLLDPRHTPRPGHGPQAARSHEG